MAVPLYHVDAFADRRFAAVPDFSRLMAVEARGVIVTARAEWPSVELTGRAWTVAEGVLEVPS